MNPANMIVRSSLEEMLETLQRRDENPDDMPPALPSRPSSKGRLPSARRSLPVNFKVENAVSKSLPLRQEEEGEEKVAVFNSGLFGNKRVAKSGREDTSYVKLQDLENYEERLEEDDAFHFLAADSDVAVRFNKKLSPEESMNFVLEKHRNAQENLGEPLSLLF